MAQLLRESNNAMILMILLLMFIQHSACSILWAKGRTGSSHNPSSTETTVGTDITSFPMKIRRDKSEMYLKAVELLESLQSAPSCTRIATSNLLNSCQSIEVPSTDSEIMIDDIKSMYAAQLAVCELRAAKAQIPDPCNFVSSASDNGEAKINDGSRKRQLNLCIQSLEGRPQWWTSYSNNIQNAVLICRATRVDIEKDDMIKILKSMITTSIDIEEALGKSLQEASQRLNDQRGFAVAANKLQQQLLHELAQSRDDTKSLFGRLIKNAEIASQSMLTKVSSAITIVESEVTKLNEMLHTFSKEALGIDSSIRNIFQQILQDSTELAASQTREWEQNRGVALQLQSSLESMRSYDMVALLETVTSVHSQLESTNELVINLHSRQGMIDQRLTALDTSFRDLETRATEVSRSLAQIDASASNVSSTLNQLTGLGNVLRTLMAWKWPFILSLLTSIYDRQWATFVAAFFCE
ncbi:hypothetical protein MMC14_002217 [Varicellaria rhodocarpa]|nr:hypothetical protein [Varicellaria rhodocarpa]